MITWNSCSQESNQSPPRGAPGDNPAMDSISAKRRDESLRCGDPGGHHKSTYRQSLRTVQTQAWLHLWKTLALELSGKSDAARPVQEKGHLWEGSLWSVCHTCRSHVCFNASVWMCNNETCQQIEGQLLRFCRNKHFLPLGLQQVTCSTVPCCKRWLTLQRTLVYQMPPLTAPLHLSLSKT